MAYASYEMKSFGRWGSAETDEVQEGLPHARKRGLYSDELLGQGPGGHAAGGRV